MKRLIIILLILSGLIGCTCTKKTIKTTDNSQITAVEKTEQKSTAENDSLIEDKTKTVVSSASEKATETNNKESTVTKTVTTFFDTSKPINQETGKPPVSSIFEATTENNTNTQISEHQKDVLLAEIENDLRKEYENRYNEIISNYQKMVKDLKLKLSEKEKPESPWKPLLIGAAIPVFFYFLFWIRKKLLKFGYM